MRLGVVVIAAVLGSKHVSEQGSEGRYTSADNSQVRFDSGPDPKVETLPGNIVSFVGNIVGIVCAHGGRKDND